MIPAGTVERRGQRTASEMSEFVRRCPERGLAPSWLSSVDVLILPKWHPACRRRESRPGSGRERENLAKVVLFTSLNERIGMYHSRSVRIFAICDLGGDDHAEDTERSPGCEHELRSEFRGQGKASPASGASFRDPHLHGCPAR